MRTVVTVVAVWLTPSALLVLGVLGLLWAGRSPGRKVRGKAHRPAGSSPADAPGVDGGHEPRGGGNPDAARSLPRGPGPTLRPSVPAHEQLLNYRPAPENRYWVNDFALAGALDQWSREVSS